MIGRYLAALPTDALQRIIAGRKWTTDSYATASGEHCILGHAEDWYWDARTQSAQCRAAHLLPLREAAGDSWLNWPPLIGRRFDRLTRRIGLQQAVVLVKSRACLCRSANRVSLVRG